MQRARSVIAGLTALGLAAGWVALGLHVVFAERIGPTVATIDAARGWGVHSGDALAVPAVLVALALFALGVGLVQRGLHPAPVPVRPLRPRAVIRRPG